MNTTTPPSPSEVSKSLEDESPQQTAPDDPYDTWDDMEEPDDYDAFDSSDEFDDDEEDFEIHGLNDLKKLNEDVLKDLVPIKGAWSVFNLLLRDRSRLEQVGMTMANVEIILSHTDFDNENLQHPETILQDIDQFHTLISGLYRKSFKNSFLSTALYFCATAFLYYSYGWSFLTILSVIFVLFSVKNNFEHNTKIKTLEKWHRAVLTYINNLNEEQIIETQGTTAKDPFDDILKLQNHQLQEEKRDWSVRVFDFFSNLKIDNKKKG